MTEPFIGEIQIFGFNFAPVQWAACDGATLPISQNTALFSLLGTMYGGNGQTTFMLPDLRGRAACHAGSGGGLTPRDMGSMFGQDAVTLQSNQIPAHSHAMNVFVQRDESKQRSSPSAGDVLIPPTNTSVFAPAGEATALFAPGIIGAAGDNQPHENRQPYLGVNFCIALQGVFPPME